MRVPATVLGAAVLLAAVSLIGFAQTAEPDPAGEPAAEEPAEQPVPEAETPLVIPDEARARKNPLQATAETLGKGKLLFGTQCAMCHGATGDGKGDLVDRLKLSVPDFTAAAYAEARTDGELFYILSQGHGSMPGQGSRLPDDEKWGVVNYIRTLAR